MQNIEARSITVGQAIEMRNKTLGAKEFIKKNKISLIIVGIFTSLISVYAVLIISFINLIKILN